MNCRVVASATRTRSFSTETSLRYRCHEAARLSLAARQDPLRISRNGCVRAHKAHHVPLTRRASKSGTQSPWVLLSLSTTVLCSLKVLRALSELRWLANPLPSPVHLDVYRSQCMETEDFSIEDRLLLSLSLMKSRRCVGTEAK